MIQRTGIIPNTVPRLSSFGSADIRKVTSENRSKLKFSFTADGKMGMEGGLLGGFDTFDIISAPYSFLFLFLAHIQSNTHIRITLTNTRTHSSISAHPPGVNDSVVTGKPSIVSRQKSQKFAKSEGIFHANVTL